MREKGKNCSGTIKDIRDLKRIAAKLKDYNYPAYILWSIILGTGYRGGDAVKLTVEDIREAIKIGQLNVFEEKTKDTRKIPFKRVAYLNSELIYILSEYIKDKKDWEYLYPSEKGSEPHIKRQSLGKIFKKVICEDLRILPKTTAIGTHTPRKTYGYMQYIEHDRDIYFVQEMFGHAATKTTKSYIGIDEDNAKEASKVMGKYIF